MPDLTTKSVHEFWNQYPDPLVYRVIAFMEGVETWTLDGEPELEEAMEKLGKELDDISTIDLSELGHEKLFIRLASGIKTGRGLRLLQAIDSVQPGSASRVLIHAEEISQGTEDPAGIFLRRNIVFERLRLLSRIFSQERFSLILKALEGEEHE